MATARMRIEKGFSRWEMTVLAEILRVQRFPNAGKLGKAEYSMSLETVLAVLPVPSNVEGRFSKGRSCVSRQSSSSDGGRNSKERNGSKGFSAND